MEHIFMSRSCEKIYFPSFICVDPNKTLAARCYYAALFHSVRGELCPHPADARLASIWIVQQPLTLQKEKKKGKRKEIHRKSTCTLH